MSPKDKSVSALMAVFPTSRAFAAFAENGENAAVLRSFLFFAEKEKITGKPDAVQLKSFIQRFGASPENIRAPADLDFEEFLNQKEGLLRLSLSVRALTDRINRLLDECGIALPHVSNSMLTRLKREPADTVYKQNVLRSLAFWIGHERADQGLRWNYETLRQLCRGNRPSDQTFHEGVRIGFAIYSRGDVIDHEIVGWLKKSLKQYIEKNISHFSYGRWGKVRSQDITTLYIDFPKEDTAGVPAAYRSCLRSAVSLAHQMAIRWALSKYCTKNRFLSIGITAGEYTALHNYLLPILNSRLPGDPVIRVTDYVRHCLLVNDIRVILCGRPYETALFNGEALAIWWVEEFWSVLYFDFVPELLADSILKNDADSRDALMRLVSFSDDETGDVADVNAVTTFFRFPHNAMLGVEIAKTLYYRRRFREALEILRVVLSIAPADIAARTLRLVLFRNLAIDAPSYGAFAGMIQQAELEALYIVEHCSVRSEDFYCEYAVLYVVKAMRTLFWAREGKAACGECRDAGAAKRTALDALEKAERFFGEGITVSPSFIRAFYLLYSLKILKAMLQSDGIPFAESVKPQPRHPDIILKTSSDFQWQIGFRRDDLPPEKQYAFLERIIIEKGNIHDDSIDLDAYRPTTYFCQAVCLWDFLPIRTVAMVKRALKLLKNAGAIADQMGQNDICIYSFTRTYGEMIPAGEFVRHMEKSVRMIEDYAGADIYEREDAELVSASGGKWPPLLMTLNLCDEA